MELSRRNVAGEPGSFRAAVFDLSHASMAVGVNVVAGVLRGSPREVVAVAWPV